jgi:DNA polymerase (family 10)
MDACRKNRKMLELNAHPERLDLSDVHCYKAKDNKVKLAISSDAHSIDHLVWINFGISTAKRGWIESSNVVNTFSSSKRLRFF